MVSDGGLCVVGAGLGRTGTHSLKLALEMLLDRPCYHMREVFDHPEHIATWHAAAKGTLPEWRTFLTDYGAAVDWPASAFWRELSDAFPDAIILLSVRDSESWWDSVSQTIFDVTTDVGRRAHRHADSGEAPEPNPWLDMVMELFETTFTTAINDKAAVIAAFERHNASVREQAPGERLVEWRVQDGWWPICRALSLPIPDAPFPVSNTREEWKARHTRAAEEAAQSASEAV